MPLSSLSASLGGAHKQNEALFFSKCMSGETEISHFSCGKICCHARLFKQHILLLLRQSIGPRSEFAEQPIPFQSWIAVSLL